MLDVSYLSAGSATYLQYEAPSFKWQHLIQVDGIYPGTGLRDCTSLNPFLCLGHLYQPQLKEDNELLSHKAPEAIHCLEKRE
jgi:hypothetical protein